MSEIIATVRSYEDMVEAFRAIKARLGLTNAVCDRLANLGDGATDKALGPTQAKNIGPLTFNAFCWLFAVQFEMRIDMDQVRIMEQHWENHEAPRWFPPAKMNKRVSKELVERAKPHVLKDFAKQANECRNTMLSGEHRSKIARKAARARWRKRRRERRLKAALTAADATA